MQWIFMIPGRVIDRNTTKGTNQKWDTLKNSFQINNPIPARFKVYSYLERKLFLISSKYSRHVTKKWQNWWVSKYFVSIGLITQFNISVHILIFRFDSKMHPVFRKNPKNCKIGCVFQVAVMGWSKCMNWKIRSPWMKFGSQIC